jgi:dCTP deaminase
MILTKKEIIKKIKEGKIKITPFNQKNIQQCSVDLRVGGYFRTPSKNHKIIKLDSDYNDFYDKIEIKNKFILKPKERILAVTLERIKLSENICGFLEGKSSIARIGLMIDLNSNLVQPGVFNNQVLEIINFSDNNFILEKGKKICQIVFEELKGREEYKGKFKYQEKP